MTREQIQMVIQVMQMNPGMTEQEAIALVMRMPPGEFVQEGAPPGLQPYDFNKPEVAPIRPPSAGVPTNSPFTGDVQYERVPSDAVGTAMKGNVRVNSLMGGPTAGPVGGTQMPQQTLKPPKSAAQLCAESGGVLGPDGMCTYNVQF